MKKILGTFMACLLVGQAFSQVKIGDNLNTINPRSLVEMESTNKGLLIPRLTTAQRNAMTSTPAGMMIYNKDTDELNVFNNGQWQAIPNNYTFNYATTDVGQTLASNGVGYQPSNFLLNRATHVLLGYSTTDYPSVIDTLMVNGNIRVGKSAAWTPSTNRLIKFGDQSFVTIGEELGDDKMVLKAKDFSFMPSSATYLGNVGIGTSSPEYSLHVKKNPNSAQATVGFQGSEITSVFYNGTAEHTYISGGKSTSSVIINELSSGPVYLAGGGGSVIVGAGGTPSGDKLEVNGSVYATRYKLKTPRTLYYTISAPDFSARNGAEVVTKSLGTGGAKLASGSTGGLVAAIHIPNGAKITFLTIDYEDGSAKDLSVTLNEYSPTLGNSSSFANLTTSGTPGSSSLGVAVTKTVSMQNYAYEVLVNTSDGLAWPASGLGIRRVVINYTVDEVD